MELLRKLVNEVAIEIGLCKFPAGKPIWLDKSFLSKNSLTESQFIDRYSYINPCSEVFSALEVDASDKLTGLCERYGGSHIGKNGGGARTANFNGCQVKGVGPNMLVGATTSIDHSYGGLDVLCAVNEVILTHLINKVFPVGAVNIYGLILIDPQLGRYFDGRSCWSVLLVREVSERPAHLLHASYFSPMEENGAFWSEESRIKFQYRRLDKDGGARHLLSLLARLIENSAKQFAFSRMAKFIHGAVTDSNLSIDGRWLDTPLVSYIPSGSNWSHISEYHNEPFNILPFLRECLYNYAKYNGVFLKPDPLVRHYLERYEYFKLKYSTFLLGIDSDSLTSVSNLLGTLTEKLESINCGRNAEALKTYPNIHTADPVAEEIVLLWQNIFGSTENTRRVSVLHSCVQNLLEALKLQTKQELIGVCISSMKRLLAGRFFYYQNTIKSVESSFGREAHASTSEYIEGRIKLIDWVYERSGGQRVTIYKNANTSIVFDNKHNHFILEAPECCTHFETAEGLAASIDLISLDFKYLNFDFTEYIEILFAVLTKD